MQVGWIGQFSRSENVLDSKKGASNQAKVAHHIKDGSKVNVPSTKDAIGGDDDGLGSPETSHNVVCSDGKAELGSLFDGLVNPTVQFSKAWLQRHPHPHNEMFVGHSFNGIDNVLIGFVQVLRCILIRVVVAVALAILWIHPRCPLFPARPLVSIAAGIVLVTAIGGFGALLVAKAFWLIKHVVNIGLPGNAFFAHFQIKAVGVHSSDQLENIVEKGIRNEPARTQCHVAENSQRIAFLLL
mmetsp:Transcript_17202/g.39895  ORF Transcript_17202/g.39895 Transcript_17202/m.39895 type:complete len:241 (-) Transcript_17202:560-1282(-)